MKELYHITLLYFKLFEMVKYIVLYRSIGYGARVIKFNLLIIATIYHYK